MFFQNQNERNCDWWKKSINSHEFLKQFTIKRKVDSEIQKKAEEKRMSQEISNFWSKIRNFHKIIIIIVINNF
jgi:hypothetical protein